jgi:hypothetical protein
MTIREEVEKTEFISSTGGWGGEVRRSPSF